MIIELLRLAGILPAIPLAVWGAAAVVAVVAGGALAVTVFGKKAKKSRVAVLGPRMAGKSTLGHYLQEGVITREYLETLTTEQFENDVDMKDLKLKIAMAVPAGGQWTDVYGAWLSVAESAHLVVFLFDTTRLSDPEYRGQVLTAAKHMQRWKSSDSLRDDVQFVVVCTHRDLHPGSREQGFEDRMNREPTIAEVRRRLQPKDILYVSLLDVEDQMFVMWVLGTRLGER